MDLRRVLCTSLAVAVLISGLAVSAHSEANAPVIYENQDVIIYRLPPKGSSQKIAEVATRSILQALASKGLEKVVGYAGSALVSKLGGLIFTFICAIPTVGVPTKAKLLVSAEREVHGSHSRIPNGTPFLPLIVLSPGDCLNCGVTLTVDRAYQGLWGRKWSTCQSRQLLNATQMFALHQWGRINRGEPVLIAAKNPLRVSTPGQYRIVVTAMCNTEGKATHSLIVHD